MTSTSAPETAPLLDTYRRNPVTFVSGRGVWLVDDTGKEYLDCLGGLAVVAAGHAHPAVTEAIATQAATLVHVSNLYWTRPMMQLATRLREITGWGDTFFANSGAEANECALKLVRKWAGPGRDTVVCAEGSFHGRTMATLAATGQPEKWIGFEPMPQRFVHAFFDDLESFAAAVDERTAAIFVEPIQGERGVIVASEAFLRGLRDLADAHGCALVFDEVQSGMGRTGHWWAFQDYGVVPDVFTSAKALANGLPIGACIANERIGAAFAPGDHGSTFGGNPVAAAAALATIDVLEPILPTVAERGLRLQAMLAELPHVTSTRGRGLLVAAALDTHQAAEITAAALRHGLVVNAPATDTIRFAPPLVITDEESGEAVSRLRVAIEEVCA